jgi:hypothetical protein
MHLFNPVILNLFIASQINNFLFNLFNRLSLY